jgi:predicted dehydrogenase/aryl-alcohol dehydrogenase-like predicted oxidoreductase
MSQKKVRWGLLGTGAIAKCFAENLKQSRTGALQAAGSRTVEKAKAFCDAHGIPTAHGSYEALIADPNVDAIYVSPPHPLHAEWTIRALRAGKHVMVEKPAGLNHAQVMAIVEAAELSGRAVMEAFQWRCHPQTARLVELIKGKAIGDVQVIESSFSFRCGFDADSRLWNNDLGGGGIMDVGCYAVAGARLIAGAAIGKAFDTPTHVTGAAKLASTGVDEHAIGTLKFASGVVAQVRTGVALNADNAMRIWGTEGSIVVPDVWVCDRKKPPQGKIIVNKGGKSEEIAVPSDVTSFTLEADALGDAILAGKQEATSPAMTWADSLSQAQTLDRWRQACGVSYAIETDKKYPAVTLAGEKLSRKPDAAMKYLDLPHVGVPMSRLVMGCDNQPSLSHMSIMNDDFWEKGGNAFDTAFIYGGGHQERLLGQWLKLRGVREQAVVIAKGCHTPMCDPRSLTWQLEESLRRLQTTYADIYMMHRDNPDVPVGEFIDLLNEHVRAGRIKAFGGSNWTLARVDEANAYAKARGLQGFTVVSNNFSLARMVDPVWAGCVAASDPESRAWFERTQTALLSWSSQARGFFLPGRAAPDKTDDAELTRCWYGPDNFQRLGRAQELARKYGVSPINIALAYVLRQPFPTIALIGPRQLSETRTSLPGLKVELTPDEVKWLNLEA